jgi:GTP cyclohydrolase II
MKINQTARKSRFTGAANSCIESCQKLTAEIGQFKHGSRVELRQSLEGSDRLFQLALNEAGALAWQTDYPHLVFPALATEKLQAAAEWTARQTHLRQKYSVRAMSN